MPEHNPVRADDVQPENVEWLLWDRIPRSMFTIVAGKPDQRKSMLATVIAAELTKQGKNVLYSSKERNPGLVEKPRFIAAGGVEKRMHYWRFSLPRQLVELAEHILEKDIDLVVMDPVSAHFIGVSMASDKGREVLNPLVELAEQTGCAFLFIEHALKRIPSHANPLDGIRGNSSGLPASCSMGFIVGNDPKAPGEGTIVCNVKHNICEQRKAIRFEVDTVEVDGVDDEVPTLVWDEEVTFDPMRLLNQSTGEMGPSKMGRPNEKREAAAEWLTNYLVKAGKPTLSKQIQEDAKHYGITGRTLRRAAADQRIVKAGNGPATTWWLPEDILEAVSDVLPAEPEPEAQDQGDVLEQELQDFLAGLEGNDD